MSGSQSRCLICCPVWLVAVVPTLQLLCCFVRCGCKLVAVLLQCVHQNDVQQLGFRKGVSGCLALVVWVI